MARERPPPLHSESAWLETLFAAGRAAWPDVDISFACFVEYAAAQHLRPAPAADRPVPAADLYLACACLASHKRSLEHFAGECRIVAARLLASTPQSSAMLDVDDLVAKLMTRLLVSASGTVRLAQYHGRGPLRRWLRMAALRLLIEAGGKARETPITAERLGRVAAPVDLERDSINRRLGGEASRALREALASLSAEERSILRSHVEDGLSVDQIGELFHVHRATAARRLRRTRERLMEHTRSLLAERLRLSASELDSVLRVLRSLAHGDAPLPWPDK